MDDNDIQFDIDLDMSGVEMNSTCENEGVTDSERRQILIAKGLTGGFSFISCTVSLVLLAILVARSKIRFRATERLVMYLIVATLIRSVTVLLQTTAADYDDNDPTDRGLCLFTAFLDQWTDWLVLLSIQMILVQIYLQLVFKMKLKPYQKRIEVFYILFPILFPLLFSWIPFIHNTYGLAGAWCWIRREDNNCNEYKEGLIEQIVLWFVWLFLFQILDCIALIIYPVLNRALNSDPEKQKEVLKKHAPLLCLMAIYFVIYWISIVNRLHSIISPVENIHLWIFHAIGAASAGFLSGLAFTIYLVILYIQRTRPVQLSCMTKDQELSKL